MVNIDPLTSADKPVTQVLNVGQVYVYKDTATVQDESCYTATNDYKIVTVDFGFLIFILSGTFPVHGLLTSLERLLVTGDASVSHLHSTSQHVRRGVTEIDSSLHHF